MNYSGKFDAKVPVDGSGLHSKGHVDAFSEHATHVPTDAIVVPDAHLLFNGDFKRSGVDLVLSKNDQELVLHDYFKGEKRAALASPDGAHLTGDIVNALAGHVEYAQADGSASVSKVIGHVTKLVGTATAVRNGVSIILNQGDNVEKGDVVQSGAASTLGITFIDGTVFGLSSNARMVLNEMVYDPNGSNNSSLLSLVAGTITFVAGETAKHGDMKVDTPVATMGIRGTAVLVEIDFDVPGQGGLPDAKFQVLVEPDGTTGSYILFDKTTLTPLAVVNQAGQQINISNGTLTQSSTGLSSEIQKLITDVFSIKFSDANTKSFDHHTDTPIPDSLSPLKVGQITVIPIVLQLPTPVNTAPSNSVALPNPNVHVNQAPTAVILNASGQAVTGFQVTELPAVTHSSALDTASGKISFVDINVGDAPTVSAKFDSFTYQNAGNTDVTAALSAQQLADIAAVEAKLAIVPAPGNSNFGSATWTYSVPDGAFDFLAKGETLTLTYDAFVDNNYLPSDLVTELKFTITITGTNDVPVITTGPQTIGFVGGKGTPGGNLTPNAPTSGTLVFTDPDLTDTHTIVSTDLTNASLAGTGTPTLDLATLEAKFPGPMAAFEKALSASVITDSTGTGTGAINWKLADLSAYLADFVPSGETLTLTYTVEVKDSQGAIATQNVIVTITGNNAPAVVWIETTATASTDAAPGDWNGASNWETGTVPTANDDAIIITNQLQTKTPFFPVTIKAAVDGGVAAFAKSLTMNDFGNTPPELDNHNSLTIGGGLSLNADAIIKNFGDISVGSLATLLGISGLAEILDKSVLQNSGTLNLAQGGDFIDQSSITNSGTIEISGGKLNVEVAVANAGGTIQIDDGATLALSDATIDGGNINDGSASGTGSPVVFGRIDVTGNSTISNASLNHGGVTVESGVTLTLDNDTVTGTTFTDTARGAIIQVDDGTTLTLSGVTIVGGTVNDGTASGTAIASGKVLGNIDVTGNSTISNANLNHGGVTVESGVTLTLDNETVTGTTFADTATGAIQIDDGTTLTLSGVTIDGGTVNDGTASGITIASGTVLGNIDVTGDSTINGANLNHGGVTLEGGVTLTLDNDTVTGTTFTDTASGAIIQVDDGTTLTLSGVTIDGGTINDGTASGSTIASGTVLGNIDVTGDSTISNASLNHGGVTLEGGVTLTLDNDTVTGTTFADTASGAIIQVDDGTTLTLSGVTIDGGTINDGTASGSTIASGKVLGNIDVTGNSAISNASLNHGGVTVASGVTLTLDNDTVTGTTFTDTASGAIIQVDDGTTLTLSGVTIDGGTVNDGTANGTTIASGTVLGNIDVTGDSTISNASLNHGGVTLEGGVTLTLDNDTVTGTTFTDTASGAIIQVDDGTTLTLSGVTIDGGTVNDGTASGTTIASGTVLGNIDVTGNSTISNASLNHGGVTLEGGVMLTLDNDTVTGTTFTDTASGAIIQVDDGTTLTLNGVTIDGGTVAISGELDSTGNSLITGATIINSSHIDVVSGTLTIDPTPVTNSGTIEVKGDGTLVLSGETITNSVTTANGTINGIIQVDADSTHLATLDLENSTIGGGTVTISGEMDSTGTSFVNGANVTNSGMIDVATGALTIDATSTLHNSGTTKVDSGATLTIHGSVDNSGTLETNGGTLVIGADATITGTAPVVTITNGGLADLVGTGQPLALNVTFSGAGTLELDDSEHYRGTIAGYGAGDTIDLTDLAYSRGETSVWNSATNTLTITSGSETVSLHLTGSFDQDDFAICDVNGTTELVSNIGSSLTQPQVFATVLDGAGNAVAGNTVTAHFNSPGNGNPGLVTYTWLENGQVDPNVTGNTFTTGPSDVGKVIDVVVGFGNEQITAVSGTVAAPPAVSFNLAEGATTNFNTPLTLNSLNLSFADAGSDCFTVTIDANHGTLSLVCAGTVKEGGTGGTLTLTGTLAAIDTALGHGLVYTPTNGFSGSDTLSVSAQDGAFCSNTATLNVTVVSPVVATINFDDAFAGTSGAALSNYFADYGITVSTAGGHAALMIEDDRDICGGGVVNATTGHNLLGESGDFPVSYTVTFAHALTSFAFDRVQEDAGSSGGSSYSEWTATAYDAAGHVLSTVSEAETTVTGSPVAAAHYVLTGADIAYVTFTGNDQGDDGFANVLTDSWVLTDAPTVPAATTLVWNTSSGDWVTSTTDWSPNSVPNPAEDANVNAASASPYTVTIAHGEFAMADTLHLDSSAATITDSGSLTLAGDLVVDHGTFDLEGGSLQALSIQVASTGSFQGDGTVNGPVSVSGTVEASSNGTLDFANYVTGTGTFNIDPFATLKFDGPVSAGAVVSFANAHEFGGHGTLALTSAASFQGQVSGFAAGDVLDVGGLQANQGDNFNVSGIYNSAQGTTLVTVTDANDNASTSVTLVGDYSNVLWSAAADDHGGVKIAMDTVTMTVTLNSSGYGQQYNTYDVDVTVVDGLTGQARDGVSVAPSFTSGAGQGAFTFLNSVFGNIFPKETGDVDPHGTADFTLNPFGYGGTYTISMLVGGAETLSQQLIVPSLGAASFTSALTAVVNFAGPQETATLTLLDRDPLYTPVSGDTVNWTGTGTFSPASGNGVTDANGNLTDTFAPNVDNTQTVTASFGDGEATASTSVHFVTMDSWINTSGGIWNDAANAGTNWSSGIPTSGEGVWIGSAGTYTVDVTATESIYGLGTMSTATLEIGSGGTLSVIGTGNSVIAGALTIDNGGELLAQTGTVQLNGAVTNNNVLEAQSGATINVANNVGGAGSIVADGGHVNVTGNLADTQAITIGGAGVVHLAKAEGGQITFSGAGMLALDAAPASGMTVHNFGLGDSLDLTNLAYSSGESLSWNSSTNTLTVHDGAASESIQFGEGHSLSDFALTADPLGTGGTDIVYNNQSLNYTHAVSDTVLPLAGQTYFMGGINNSGIALVVGEVVSGTPAVGVSDNYFYVNGHLISLPGSPLNNPFGVGEVFGGINNAQKIVLSFEDAGGDQYAETYLGNFDSSTRLADGSGGAIAQFSGPGQLKTSFQPGFLGEGLGINDNNVIVGFFTDATGLTRQNQSGDQSHVFVINGPPGGGFNGNPQGNLEHEYGFIWSSSSGYTLINAGTSSNVVNGSNDPSPGVSYFGGATPTDGVAYTVLTDINNAGIAVGYYMDGESVEHAFIFNTVTHAFTFIPDQTYPVSNGQLTSTVATAINSEGIVVGYYGHAFATNSEVDPYNSVQSFVYDSNTNQFLTANFTLPGGGSIGLTGINDNGMVSGESGDNLVVASLQPIVTIDNGGTLYLTTATSETIHFGGGTGELVLDAHVGFGGEITGFSGTAADAAHSDVIDIANINYVESANFHATYYSSGFLSLSEGVSSIQLSFQSYTGGFAYTTDGHGGTLVFDPPSGPTTIADGELYEVTAASSDTITFAGSAGKLQLDNPASFTGHVAGFAGTAPDAAHSDVLDLAGIDFNSTKFAETYQSATGALTVTDGTNSANLTLDNFNGTLDFVSDGNGGTAITGVSSALNTPHMAVVPVAVADPAQAAASTIVASAPNQTLTGTAVSDTFAFNFANVGQAIVTNFHTETDTLQFNSQLFANIQAALNATHDDGHGNTVITLDAHDTITLSGVVKAQLHASDFHFA